MRTPMTKRRWAGSMYSLLIGLMLTVSVGCELTRDYSAVPLREDAASSYDAADIVDAADSTDTHDATDGGGLTGKQPCPEPPVSGQIYYVAPDADASGDGTRASPLDPDTAAANVQPGDTVLFLPGTYQMSFSPASSGRAGAPITLRSADRHQAKMAGLGGNSVSFSLEGLSHIHLEGFKFVSGSTRWIRVVASDHIVMSDLWLEDHDGVGAPLVVEDSEHISFVDNVARRSVKWLLVNFDNVSSLRIAGNSFSMNHARPLAVRQSDRVVIRANVFHNQVGRAGLFRGNQDVLFEDNVWTNLIEGPGNREAYSRLDGSRIIFRHNRAFRNWGTPLALDLDRSTSSAEQVRVYHNVFDDTRDRSSLDGEGWWASVGVGVMSDVVFKNNVFSRNAGSNGHVQLAGGSWGGELSLTNNAFWAGAGNTPTITVDATNYTAAEAAQSLGGAFVDNVVEDPRYRGAADYDHRLHSDSALIDAGQALTTARSAGSGSALPVEDSAYFYDGYGIDGEVGDVIAVGEPARIAHIVAIDHATRTLTLDRSDLRWSEGDAVHLQWSGRAPDIGMWEDGSNGRAAVGIDYSAFVSPAGDPVVLRPHLDGDIDAARFEWRLGDGSLTCGRSFEHTYPSPGDYPVRLKVIDRDGRVRRGAAYLLVDGEGVDVDSVDYNKQLMDEYLCDGQEHPYTNGEAGWDKLVERVEQGYQCSP